jgi:S1-C subfamily serine protease
VQNKISGTSAGVGFAIPSDIVSKVVSQLIAFGKVTMCKLRKEH